MDEKKQKAAATHIEDIESRPLDANALLSDEQLAAGGVVPVHAYMRTRVSKAAERQRRARAKKKDEGQRQLNLNAPADDAARDALKKVSQQLLDGDVSPSDLDLAGRVDIMRLGRDVNRTLNAGGFRAILLRKILKLTN